MLRLFCFIPLLLIVSFSYAQTLSQVSITEGGNLASLALVSDQKVLIRISQDGKIIEWGREVLSDRYNYYAPNLQPFMGRVDYYGPESDSSSRGKVKSIGTCVIRYFGGFEIDSKKGKIQSIGSLMFDYFSNYDNAELQGKIKSIGSMMIDYYSSFENEAIRGKLKAIANTPLSYYSSFDDKAIRGKIKSIGNVTYSWYTSLDRKEYRGGLKSGQYRQAINGITYIVR